jgi:hypothetical protein
MSLGARVAIATCIAALLVTVGFAIGRSTDAPGTQPARGLNEPTAQLAGLNNESLTAFNAARASWRAAPLVFGSAAQGYPLESARGYLALGIDRFATSMGQTSQSPRGWTKAQKELTLLMNTPDTDVRGATAAHAEAAIRWLDAFFGTPGLFGRAT